MASNVACAYTFVGKQAVHFPSSLRVRREEKRAERHTATHLTRSPAGWLLAGLQRFKGNATRKILFKQDNEIPVSSELPTIYRYA